MSILGDIRKTINDELVEFVGENGVDPELAQHAIDRCKLAMQQKGLGVGGAALAVGVFMGAPVAPLAIIGATAAGAAIALARSPKCADVREAITFWATKKVMSTNEEATTLFSDWTKAFD